MINQLVFKLFNLMYHNSEKSSSFVLFVSCVVNTLVYVQNPSRNAGWYSLALLVARKQQPQNPNIEYRNSIQIQMSNDRMFQTDIFDRYSSMPLFWSLEPLDFGHCFELALTLHFVPCFEFRIYPSPYGGAAAGTGTQAAKRPVQPVDSLLGIMLHALT
jgi:hypothetical protein